MSKVSRTVDILTDLAQLLAIFKIFEIEKGAEGKVKVNVNSTIKTGVKIFGFGSGEEALWARVISQLKNPDGTPDTRTQKEITEWFAGLENEWWKLEFQLKIAKIVDQSGRLDAALDFLRSLADMGRNEEGDQIRTDHCLAQRYFSPDKPWWFKTNETIQDMMSNDWPDILLKRVKEVTTASSNGIANIVSNFRNGLEEAAVELDVETKSTDYLTKQKARLEELKNKRNR